jgi:fructoselysine transporter
MTELTRKLGMGHTVAIIVGTVIGSGVFFNLPIVAKVTGSPMMAALAWLIGGLVWIPQILIITEMATAYPEEGFGYLYLRKAGSPFLAFLYVWIAFISSDTPSITIISLAAISSISIFWQPLTDPVISRFFAIMLIIILTIPHLRDVKQGGNLQIVLTIAKIVPLIMLIFIGFFYYADGNLYFENITNIPVNTVFTALLGGVSSTVFCYAGFPNILYMAGEVKNPKKVLPISLISSVIGVMIGYILISLGTSAIVPHHILANSTDTFVNPFQYMPLFSSFAATFFAIAAFISMVGATNASIMVQPRIEYAIAKDGLFFKPFAHINEKYQTPDYSIMIQAGFAILLTLIGGIESLLGYFTLSYVLQNAIVYFAIFKLRKLDDYKPTYLAPMWKSMTVISILVQILLAVGSFIAFSFVGVLSSAILIVIGIPVFLYFKKTGLKIQE